ncbi:hypothetical protein FRC06_006396 [Ceratobasidium sp. 370]|nr:hypothetical protein FRC06_006396 [Ceratobasidium sp. 370]
MCPPEINVKVEEVEDAPSPGRDRGAKAERNVPEPVTHSKAINSRPERAEAEDDDDVLTSLCALFDGMWPDSADDDSESESDESEPGSPRCRGFEFGAISKTYFFYGDNRYFFDQDHNVFLEGEFGRTVQIHRGVPFPNLDDNLLDLECIEGLPYYFGIDGNLWSLDQDMNPVQVPTLTEFDQILNSAFAGTIPEFSQDGFVYGSNFGFQDPSQTAVPNGAYCDSTKVEADPFNPNPLQGSLQGRKAMPWSPPSSATSPIVPAGSRATSSEPLEPLISAGNLGWLVKSVQAWKEETKVIQQDRNPISDKLDRRRCRHCQKVFRRPSSLEDHLNVHTGAKPHKCPFERCHTGFATKSNMKRHFITHRVGTLEEYARNGKLGKANSLTATYNAKAFHTQRFRLVSA